MDETNETRAARFRAFADAHDNAPGGVILTYWTRSKPDVPKEHHHLTTDDLRAAADALDTHGEGL